MNQAPGQRRLRILSLLICGGLLLLSLGCGGDSAAEVERARQAEAEAAKKLRECQEELAQARKALEAARRGRSKSDDGDGVDSAAWNAARITAEEFLQAVNSRDADAANALGTKEFRQKNGGANALNAFRRFRGDAKGYSCALLKRLEAVPGKEEFVGRGELHYRQVPRQDSSYTLRIVKEGDNWRVASFTAVER